MSVIAKYQILSVNQLDYHFVEKKEEVINKGDVLYNINISINWIREEKRIDVTCRVNYVHRKTTEVLCYIVTLNSFGIANYDEVISMTDENIETPNALLKEMFNVAVHTARGLLIARNENNYLKGIIIGAFDPSTLVKSMNTAASQIAD